jgi:hypothetical protein
MSDGSQKPPSNAPLEGATLQARGVVRPVQPVNAPALYNALLEIVRAQTEALVAMKIIAQSLRHGGDSTFAKPVFEASQSMQRSMEEALRQLEAMRKDVRCMTST